MALRLYNTLTRKTELLKPLKDNTIKMYTCGPTVYDYPHLGNYRAYIVSDLLKRYLRYKGYNVMHVMNITDVDDKTIRGAQSQRISLKQFTKQYEEAFFEDLDSLSILPADKFPRATEHVDEMRFLIRRLIEKGLAYKADDGSVYFNVKKFSGYGKLASINLKQLKTGASGRVKADEYSKEDVHDFALWKAYAPEDGNVFWESEFGKGRPGWHVECSAMSMRYLGETFDVHCGGIDLIFPHHQNEIAQSEGSTGKRFVRHWVHNEWLLVDGQKMSKSLGNFYTLRNVLEKRYDAKSARYLLLSTHYRQQLNFTFKGLDAARNSVERLQETVRKLKEAKGRRDDEEVDLMISEARKRFNEAMDDDLNISEALAAVFDFAKDINKSLETGISKKNAEDALELLEDFNEILGVIDFSVNEPLTEEQFNLIETREMLRKKGKFAEADKIRAQLKNLGIQLDDTKEGVKWKKIS